MARYIPNLIISRCDCRDPGECPSGEKNIPYQDSREMIHESRFN